MPSCVQVHEPGKYYSPWGTVPRAGEAHSGTPSILIHLRPLDERTLSVDVAAGCSVLLLKSVAAAMRGVPVDSLKLVLRGRNLENDLILDMKLCWPRLTMTEVCLRF